MWVWAGVFPSSIRRTFGARSVCGLDMAEEPLKSREIIFQFYPVGAYVRVTAMDVLSLTEVATQGPRTAPEETLKRNAAKRLEFVLRKKGII